MDLAWRYNSYTLPLFLAVAISTAMAVIAWRRREAPGALALLFLMLATAEWSLGYSLELASSTLAAKILWGKVQYVGIGLTPVAWLVFIVQFTGYERWLTRPNLALVGLIPLITQGLVWTTEFHGLVWQQTWLEVSGSSLILAIRYGPWFWVNWAFAIAMILAGSVLLVLKLGRTTPLYRWQTALLLGVVLLPWLGNGLYVFRLLPAPHLDLTPLAFALSGLIMAWNLVHYRLLDIMPVARRTVVEEMSDGVIVFDRHNRLVDLNPVAQRLLHCQAPRAIGKSETELLSSWPCLLEQYRVTAEGQVEINREEPPDLPRYFDARFSLLYNQRRQLQGRLVLLHDITERKQAEAALNMAYTRAVEASELKSQLLANVSHELRTPLGVIMGYAELLQLGAYGPLFAEQEQIVTEIVSSTQYLNELVSQILDQSRLESGRLVLQPVPFVVQEMIEQVETKMRVLAEAKNLAFSISVGPDVPPTLVGDVTRLQQILINLIGNAIKFTSAGQVEVLIYCPDPAHWGMVVKDSGPGIPPEAHTYIFEPFRQVDGSMTREFSGAGLGLSIVKQLTLLMKGGISLDSEVGRGSAFAVSLPLILPQAG